MLIDTHPYIFIYLLGSVLVVLLTLFKTALFYTVDWMIRANVLQKNMRKLLQPDESSFGDKALKSFGLLLVEAFLSWVNVAVILWQILSALFRVARDQLQAAPEAISILRFPLRNNPDMSRETVWAYCQALGVKAGHKLPTKEELVNSLNEISRYYPTFDRVAALKHLESLNTVNPEVTLASLAELS